MNIEDDPCEGWHGGRERAVCVRIGGAACCAETLLRIGV